MRAFGLTDVGIKRTQNQDAFFLDPARQLYIVADGMGGHKSGDLASRTSVEAICDYFEQENLWDADSISNLSEEEQINREVELCRQGIKYANKIIHDKANSCVDYHGMGTTIVLLKIVHGHAIIAHVGDSRIYRIQDETITQLTKDHSRIQELIDQERITAAEAEHYPLRNVITRALGGAQEVEVDTRIIPLGRSDVFVLCTDGLTCVLKDDEILDLVSANPGDPEESCSRLIQSVLDRGAPDNVTVIISDTRAYDGLEPRSLPPSEQPPDEFADRGAFRRFIDKWFRAN